MGFKGSMIGVEIAFFLAFLGALSSCGKIDKKPAGIEITTTDTGPPAKSSDKAITDFRFTAAANPALSTDVVGTITKNQITATVPQGTDKSALVADFTTTGASVAVSGITQNSGTTVNDFSSSVTYRVSAEDKSTQDYQVLIDSLATTASNDVTGPTNPSLSINSNGTSTTSTSVTLSLSATDNSGVSAYFISESSQAPSSTDSGWVKVTSTTSYSGSTVFTLSATEGSKPLYAWYQDDAGNLSEATTDSILLTSSWTKQNSSSGTDYTRELSGDSAGNIYFAGSASGSIDGQTALGGQDVIISKYNAAGTLQWTKQEGTTAGDGVGDIQIDAAGNLYVFGTTAGSFGTGGLLGSNDYFLAKYDAAGTLQWRKQSGTNKDDRGVALAVDSAGNSFVVGYSYGAFPANSYLGGWDLYLAKYDSSGTRLWVTQTGTTASDAIYDVAIDSNSNVYLTGFSYGNLHSNSNQGSSDIIVLKYDSNGNRLWTKQIGTAQPDVGYGIDLDKKGNIYVTGVTGASLNNQTYLGSSDIFLLKLDTTGTLLWTKQLGTANADTANGMYVDAKDGIYLTGYVTGAFAGNVDHGGIDMFIAKFDGSGTLLWTKQPGTAGDDKGWGIWVDANGNVWLGGDSTGAFEGTNLGLTDMVMMKNPSGFLP